MRYCFYVCSLLGLSALLFGCTQAEMGTKYVKPVYELVKVDTVHGFAYPYDFDRARDLRSHGMFERASYVYIHLYPEFPDSVVSEVHRMAEEIRQIDSTTPVSYYLTQGIGKEALNDPAVFDRRTGKLIQPEMNRLYSISSELLGRIQVLGSAP